MNTGTAMRNIYYRSPASAGFCEAVHQDGGLDIDEASRDCITLEIKNEVSYGTPQNWPVHRYRLLAIDMDLNQG